MSDESKNKNKNKNIIARYTEEFKCSKEDIINVTLTDIQSLYLYKLYQYNGDKYDLKNNPMDYYELLGKIGHGYNMNAPIWGSKEKYWTIRNLNIVNYEYILGLIATRTCSFQRLLTFYGDYCPHDYCHTTKNYCKVIRDRLICTTIKNKRGYKRVIRKKDAIEYFTYVEDVLKYEIEYMFNNYFNDVKTKHDWNANILFEQLNFIDPNLYSIGRINKYMFKTFDTQLCSFTKMSNGELCLKYTKDKHESICIMHTNPRNKRHEIIKEMFDKIGLRDLVSTVVAYAF